MPPSGPTRERVTARQADLLAVLGLLAVVVVLFGDALFAGGGRALSVEWGDLATQFVHWRRFGFGELARGNLPLWNPHLYAGTPFFGGFQAALLYPPNWLYLVLPLPLAINTGIVLHVLLSGLFAWLWARRRGLHPLAALLAGVLMMLAGPQIAHVFPGHLSNLCSMPWIVLLLLCIDAVLERGRPGWVLPGTAAVALLILAGHPQYVFYTAVIAGAYVALHLVRHERRAPTVLLLAAIAVGGALLASAQLATGLLESAWSARGAGVSLEFAGSYSLGPESLLTALVPGFFGWADDGSFWGRANPWEMSAFFSLTGLVLAVFACVHVAPARRRFALALVGLALLLALGRHTPLFRLLYELVPGFGSFRGSSKFVFQAVVFGVLLAALGLDRILAGSVPGRRWIFGVLAAAAALGLAAVALDLSVPEPALGSGWHAMLKALADSALAADELSRTPSSYDDEDFVGGAASVAVRALWLGAATLALVSGVLALARRSPTAAAACALILALVELLLFARQQRPSFDPAAQLERQQAIAAAIPAGRRMQSGGNSAMSSGALDVWGVDPARTERYEAFIRATQGLPADANLLAISRLHRVYAMLRLHAAIVEHGQRADLVRAPAEPLPRLLLLRRYRVLPQEAVLSALIAPGFDPRREVLLETVPEPAPSEGAIGSPDRAAIVSESTDELTLEANLADPALLLVTDAWHPFWRAEALAGSAQDRYQVLAADYVLRAIPLAAGRHRLRLVYDPPGLAAGFAISGTALLAWLAGAGWLLRARFGIR